MLETRLRNDPHCHMVHAIMSGHYDPLLFTPNKVGLALKTITLAGSVWAKIPFMWTASQLTKNPALKGAIETGEILAGFGSFGSAWCALIDKAQEEHLMYKLIAGKTYTPKTILILIAKATTVVALSAVTQGTEMFIAIHSGRGAVQTTATTLFVSAATMHIVIHLFSLFKKKEPTCTLLNLYLKNLQTSLLSEQSARMLTNELLNDETLSTKEFCFRLLKICVHSKEIIYLRQNKCASLGRTGFGYLGAALSLTRSAFRVFILKHFAESSIHQTALLVLLILVSEGPETFLSSSDSRKSFILTYKALFSFFTFIPNEEKANALAPVANRVLNVTALIFSVFGIGWAAQTFFTVFNIESINKTNWGYFFFLLSAVSIEAIQLTRGYSYFTNGAIDLYARKYGSTETQKLAKLARRIELIESYLSSLSQEERNAFLIEMFKEEQITELMEMTNSKNFKEFEYWMEGAIKEELPLQVMEH